MEWSEGGGGRLGGRPDLRPPLMNLFIYAMKVKDCIDLRRLYEIR